MLEVYLYRRYSPLADRTKLMRRCSLVDSNKTAMYLAMPIPYAATHVLDTRTKTTSSNRHIPLTDTIRSLLDAQKAAQMRQRLSTGEHWTSSVPGQGECFVFATRVGTVIERNNLSRTLRTTLDKTNIERRGVHALRHTFATSGIIHVKDTSIHTVSKLLGHTKIAFTMQKYVTSDMEAKQASMEAIDSLI